MTPDTITSTFDTWVNNHPLLFGLLIIWSLTIKGMALWKAAEREQKPWFIVILVVNTFGLLDLLYIFLVARKYKVEVVEN